MSTRIARVAVLTALVACLSNVASAQEWAQKMFDKQKVDFGVVARGADAVQMIKVTNLYKETIHIASVTTTCGCSAAKPEKNTLASREVTSISVTMDTRKFTKRKDSNVVVTIDKPYYAQVRIPVTAYIRTDVVLQPGSANFGAVAQGQESTRQVDISYAGRDDWKLSDVKSASKYVDAKVTETSRDGGRATYMLTVRLLPSAPTGLLRTQLTLSTNDANAPTFPVLVEARVESDITITPGKVSLGTVAAGSEVSQNIVVRGRKPFSISDVTCASKNMTVAANIQEATRPVHVLKLDITVPDKVGDFSEELSVTIPGRPEPVKFIAYGKIAK